MTLDPDAAKVLELVEQAGYPKLHTLSPADARAQFEATAAALDLPGPEVHGLVDRTVPGPYRPIPVRVYWPRPPEQALPVTLYFHGGGFVIGGLESYDSICRRLALGADSVVVSVDYGLAPEHKCPVAIEECNAALRWAAASAAELGADPKRLGVAGDSAGGNLAALAALAARDEGLPLAFQALIYPTTAPEPESASHHAFAEGRLLERETILWFFEQYLDGTDVAPAVRAPLVRDELAGLAPALVIVAGHDPLLDEGVEYAEKLRAAGVPVTLSRYEGQIHGFFSLSGAIPDGRRAMDEVAGALRAAFLVA